MWPIGEIRLTILYPTQDKPPKIYTQPGAPVDFYLFLPFSPFSAFLNILRGTPLRRPYDGEIGALS